MSASLEELIDTLYENIQDAATLPLSGGKCLIDQEKILDILDDVRATLPSDLKMAKDIVDKRNEMIAAGKREAEAMRSQAEAKVREMINKDQMVTEAKHKAVEILGNAQIQAKELRQAANDYCEDTLKRTEENVAMALDEIKKIRQRFRAMSEAAEKAPKSPVPED
jgi:cell division septum initiation protein DivIVA